MSAAEPARQRAPGPHVPRARPAWWTQHRLLGALLTLLIAASAGCPLPQDAACEAYVGCQRAVDASVDVTPYDEGGSCWASPAQARACTARCALLLATLQDLPDAPDACFPGGAPDATERG